MRLPTTLAALSLGALSLGALTLAAGLAVAQDGPTPEERAVDARQAHMSLYAFNLGTLGGMAQGAVPFDAAVAEAAGANLNYLAQVDQRGYWIEGTAVGEVEDSNALPAIWDNQEDFQAKHAALQEAVAALEAAAGTDQAGLGAALGAVGAACGACHESYRAPMN